MLVIQVRGTSGSGKTYAVRKVMEAFCLEPFFEEGRKRPLGYSLGGLTVLGSYESACGGGDTIGSAKAIYEKIQGLTCSVCLVEGLLLSEDTRWTIQLPEVKCLFLTTPIEDCIRQVKIRRLAVGNEKPLNEENTRNRVGVIERARIKLTEAGVWCRRVSSSQAPDVILETIRLENLRRGPCQ